jgi:putative ABC transport system ATP-binding protein
MIEFHNVSKIYVQGQRQVAALNNLSVTVQAGEFVVVTGPSGSGKSSFLHLAGGLDVPSSGRVIVDGHELGTLSDDALTLFRRNRIGFVFQFFNLMPTLSVLENTVLPALLSGGRFADVRPVAERLLAEVGLADRMTHRPEELSGGEMQRVAIARALINDPVILLADEPTGNLDSATGAEILALLREFHRERTLVIVTHDRSMESVADRAIHVRDGRLA